MTNSLLLIDTPTNKLVNLPSGKLAKNNQRVPIQRQKDMNSVLLALRRLAFFTQPSEDPQAFTLLERLKTSLSQFNQQDYGDLIKLGEEICLACHIDLKKAVIAQPTFLHHYQTFIHSTFSHLFYKQLSKEEYFNYTNDQQRWLFIFIEVIQALLMPIFNLQQASFSPTQGFLGLMASLNQHGAHVFMGSFGDGCDSQIHLVPEENTLTRKVFRFTPDSQAEKSDCINAIIVDQVKIVNNSPMVFFRHPNDQSAEGEKEQVYMISYEPFVKRLQHFYLASESAEEKFAIVSKYPLQLLASKKSVVSNDEQTLKYGS